MNPSRTYYRFLAATVFAVLAIRSPAGINTRQTQRPAQNPLSQPARANVSREYGNLPLVFEPNVGQTDARVRFLARGGCMTAFFTDTEAALVLSRRRPAKTPGGPRRRAAAVDEVEQAVVRMKLAGTSRARRAAGLEKLPGISNYFIGNDPSKWRTDVPHFARIQYEGVYPGIDLVWYGNQRRLEYDFVVAPGADPKQIQVAYEGVESLGLEANGELVLRTGLGEVRQQKPRVYQETGGKRVEVGARYAIVTRNRVSFELARYDRKRELRIDPVVLVYSTYLGGSGGDEGDGIAVDAAGSAYVTGYSDSTNFPTQSPYRSTLQGSSDAFVTKLTPAGNALVYSTYLGGSGDDDGQGIAVDAAGSAYVTGYSNSTNFPTQSPYQATFQGEAYDAFVTKLTPAGDALVYSTYLGGRDWDQGRGIAVDAVGSAYVTGWTHSTNFPTQSPYQATYQGGGDLFVTKLTPAGNALVYSTYLGGNASDGSYGIAVDAAGSAYVTGATASTDFPTQSPYQATYQSGGDAFVTKLTPAGNALVYSTYLGGSSSYGFGIAVDGAGSAYVMGQTSSTNFPTQSPYQATNQGSTDAFVTKLTPAGNALVYSTYLGGSGHDYGRGIAVDAAGSAYVTGYSDSTNFPVQSPYRATYQGSTDAFVTKIQFDAGSQTPPQINAGGVVNNASYNTGASGSSAAAPGEIAAVFGTNLTNGTSCLPPACNPAFGSDGKLNTTMAGAQVTVNGVPVPIFYAAPGQLGIQIPFEMAGTAATVSVSVAGQASTPSTITLAPVSPGIFTASSDGKGAGAITHVDGSAVNTQNPAHGGELVILYATGLGQVSPAVSTGALPAVASNTVAPVTLTIGGINVIPDFAGLAGCCVGLNQINARVPFGVSSGNAVSVVLSIGGKSSNSATIAVQ